MQELHTQQAAQQADQQAAYQPARREVAVYQPGKSPIIKGLIPGLTERGKIKIGRKGAERQSASGGTWQLPEKLDHFIVTTLERGKDGNFLPDADIHKLLGEKPKRIQMRFLFDDISLNFQCRYACYRGKTLWCSGDGEAAFRQKEKSTERETVQCPCHRQDPAFQGDDGKGAGKCKINGTLSVVIEGANCVGGVWKFRTTGYNSTVGILSSLTLLKSLTGGILAGIPLAMTIQPKVATNPVTGQAVTVYVVGVEYAGDVKSLQNGALEIAQRNAEFRQRLIHVEDEARKLIGVSAGLVDQAGDISEEFYPEEPESPQLAGPAPAQIPAPAPAPSQAAIPAAPVQTPVQAPETPAPAPRQRRRRNAAQEAAPVAQTAPSATAPATVPASQAQAPAAAPAPATAQAAVPATAQAAVPPPASPMPALTVPQAAKIELF